MIAPDAALAAWAGRNADMARTTRRVGPALSSVRSVMPVPVPARSNLSLIHFVAKSARKDGFAISTLTEKAAFRLRQFFHQAHSELLNFYWFFRWRWGDLFPGQAVTVFSLDRIELCALLFVPSREWFNQ